MRKNKILSRTASLFIVLCLIIPAFPISAAALTGEGTEDNPFLIYSAAELKEITDLINTGTETYATACYKLMENIDLSEYDEGYEDGKGWSPIGTYEDPFKGCFDGNGKIITGLYIDNADSEDIGLFGAVYGCEIKNLGVEGVDITGDITGDIGYDAGGVVGYLQNSIIMDCYSTGTIRGNSNVGGVVGCVVDYSSITNCYFTGVVSGVEYIGGVAGLVEDSSAANCYSAGSVAGDEHIGGVAGCVDNSSITGCYSTGAVSGLNYIGGVVGTHFNYYNTAYSKITNCAALNPSVEAIEMYSGRILGYSIDGKIALSGNVAFDGIISNSGAAGWINIGNDKLDGESKTAEELQATTGFPVLFSEAPWVYESAALPGLGAPVDMPEYLKITPQLETITATLPLKTTYFAGETLDLDGMVVTARYSYGIDKAVVGWTSSPTEGTALTTSDTWVTIRYTENNLTVITGFGISIQDAEPVEPPEPTNPPEPPEPTDPPKPEEPPEPLIELESITVTLPLKTTYFAGELLDLSGMVVTARYSSGEDKVITDWTSSPTENSALTISDTRVTISYTEGNATKTASFTVTVEVTIPEPEPIPLAVSVTTPTIVETLAAYLNIAVTGDYIGSEPLSACLLVGDELFYETAITNGAGRMYISAAPNAGEYELVVKSDDGSMRGVCTIDVTEYNTDIWVMNTTINIDGYVVLQFNEIISAKDGLFNNETRVNGETVSCRLEEDGVNLVVNIKYDDLQSGENDFVVTGVKYPRLFPSYSFTFTAIINK